MKRSLVSVVRGTLLVAGAAMALEPGERPEFPDIVLTSLDGQTQTVSDFKGAVTVLNFWATWCGPCRMELPELEKVYNELGGKGFVVLAINTEGGRAPVKQFMEKMGLSLPVFLVDGQTQAQLGINSVPFTILLDRQGRVIRAYPGYSKASMADLKEQARAALAEGGA